jgi:two-component system OmpR family sensor kinase
MLSLVTLGLVVIGVASAWFMRDYLLERVDEQLTSTSKNVDVGRLLRFSNEVASYYPPSDFFIRLVTPEGGAITAHSPNREVLPGLPATRAELERQVGKPYTTQVGTVRERWRVLVTARQGGYILMVGESLSDVDSTIDQLIAVELVIGVGVLFVLATAGVAIVRSSLRPLREIERTAAAIAAGDLTRRVPETNPETEAGRLAGAFNTMLTQIEGAFLVRAASEERMRQFVADASHELRTPLTTIRGFAELYRQGAVREPGEIQALLRRIEDEAARMGLLVEDLLLLARLDRERPLTLAPVDLRVIVADAAEAARAVAPDREVALESDVDGPVDVEADEPRMRQVVGNLVTNALTHTPAGSSVALRLRVDGPDAVIEVADSGPGLTPDQADRVFERFYRVDKARTRQAAGHAKAVPAARHSGTGLGLAIVAALVAAHGGRVEVDTTPGAGATFRVRLPQKKVAPYK